MSTMTRTDIHRPSAPEFDPEGYEFFAVADLHPEEGWRPVQLVSRLVSEGWSFRGAPHGSGQCSHCGAHLRYAALMGHTATKTLLYIGETCLDNRFSGTKADFDSLRKAAAAKREESRRNGKAAAFLAEHPEAVYLSYAMNIDAAGATPVWSTANAYGEEFATREEAEAALDTRSGMNDWVLQGYKYGTTFSERTRMGDKVMTLNDMWNRIQRYGEISEKALNYANLIMGWLDEASQRLVAREAEAQAKVDAGIKVPTGRVEITGTVTTTKWVDNGFGGSLKMRVESPEGWAVWGTVPSALDVEKGDTVTFTATVEPSRDDQTFGFYKRPAKARKG